MDEVKIKILDDGSFKIETDKVSAPNHVNCERLLRDMFRLAGGKIKQMLKPGAHHHHHGNHSHTHDHGSGHQH